MFYVVLCCPGFCYIVFIGFSLCLIMSKKGNKMTDKEKLKDRISHQLVQLADYTFTINSLFNANSLHEDREYVFWRVKGLHDGMKSLVKILDEQGLIEKDKPNYHGDETAKQMIDSYLQYKTLDPKNNMMR